MGGFSQPNYKDTYEILDEIGKGGYGKVFKAKNKITNEDRAIKIININLYIENLKNIYITNDITDEIRYEINKYVKRINNEIGNMKKCANINSVKLYDFYNNKNEIALIMELCDNNLRDLLKEKEKGFEPKEIYEIMNQLNNTFRIMKENNIVHRDIKLDNILIQYFNKDKKKYIVKLTDYGASKNINNISICKSFVGTLETMAPELLKMDINDNKENQENEKYNSKCDLWSIGVILYELLFKKSPYLGSTQIAILKNINIKNKSKDKFFENCEDKNLNDLIRKLLEEDPNKRINWEEYFNHPFFKQYSNELSNEIILRYDIKGKYKIKSFGEQFIKNNKNKCKMVYKGKEMNLSLFYTNKRNENILEIKLVNINNITDMSYMFFGCDSLMFLPDISKWNTSNVTNMKSMFHNCSSLLCLPDISNWNTSKVSDMSYLFCFCFSLKYLPNISKWDTSKVKNMSNMFSFCSSLSSLPDISKWNTSNVIDLNSMFYECKLLLSLPNLSKWNTSKVFNMSSIFCNCYSLLSLPDISRWNTSNVETMNEIFCNCSSLSSLPDISKWDTSNVNDMSNMFDNCESLSSLPDISKWDTSNVTNMKSMFENCEELTHLPNISKWNTSNVNNMSRMFILCFSLLA